ncbi:MAG: TonB-dependent receptor [Porticoccaceae bacterium]|nr:TonB-dependent receptor [Porticoccaceae bacterium]
MSFRKSTLSSSIALILASVTAPVIAEEELMLEEIIVEGGIRGSLKRSMDIKRDSNGVVDAISAEDIGKFPDTNLAESLQRITGVSISRVRGEGSSVTVRGFGPEYNLVTLNGRQMPTHNSGSRSFDFGDLASEGVSGVQVYKTARADMPTGGIGSLINISTTRPLDSPGQIASFTAKAKYDPSARQGGDIAPEISAIYSNTFADDTIGIAITTSYSERENGVNSYNTTGWFTDPASKVTGEMPPDDANQINRPTVDSGVFMSVPRAANYTIEEFASQRINGQLTLQWTPADDIRATLDYTYSEFDLDRVYNSFGGWFTHSGAAGGRFTEWETYGQHASPLVYTEVSDPVDNAMALGSDGRVNENESLGFNIEWRARENLTFAIDYHDSSAETSANNPYGTSVNVNIASFNRVTTTVDYTEELPVITLGMNSGSDPDGDGPLQAPSRPLYKSDMLITGSVIGNDIAEMNIEQTRFKGTFDLSDVTSIDFGLESTEVTNQGYASNVELGTWGGIGETGMLDDILTRADMSEQFDQISGYGNRDRTTEFFIANANDVAAIARQIYADTGRAYQDVGDCGDGYCPSTNWELDQFTKEESYAGYVQVNHTTEFKGMPLNAHFGIRYEETDVTSKALAEQGALVYTVGGDEFYIIKGAESVRTPYKGSYDKTLPSLDIDLTVSEDVVLRWSMSQTITRPGWGDIKGGIVAQGGNFKIDGPRASGGNPGLEPMLSTNLDLSLEWYYDEGSYFSVGYFEKDVEDFIGTDFRYETLFGGLPDPTESKLFAAVGAELGYSGDSQLKDNYREIATQILSDYDVEGTVANQNVSNEVYVVDGEARLVGVAGEGDPYLWKIRSPANQEDAKVDGIEINLQHNFGTSGFGVIANATFVDADVAFDNSNLEGQFVLNGLSDSANLVVFYDKNGIQARIAYNWRDDYLAGVGQDQGRFTNPQNVRSFDQIDISASYEYSENLSFFFSGINIGESTYRVYSREYHQVLQMGQTGARYDVGMTYKF